MSRGVDVLAGIPQGKWQVLGMLDQPNCHCCGKKNLKRTVHLLHIDSGEEYHFGVDCATRALRSRYQGRTYRLSREAMTQKARYAGMSADRQRRAGYYDASQFQMEVRHGIA